ncbi:MAG: rRNA maturation RNAse YbeY, partial [Pseudomonadota bacterium]
MSASLATAISGTLIDLVVEEEGWLTALPDLPALAETAARTALDAAGLSPEDHEIALLACDDARVADLNAEFRGKPSPTNLLSWPAHDLALLSPGA